MLTQIFDALSHHLSLSHFIYIKNIGMVSRKAKSSKKRAGRKRSRRSQSHPRRVRSVPRRHLRRQHAGQVDVLPPYDLGMTPLQYQAWQPKAPSTPPPSYRRPSRPQNIEKPLPSIPKALPLIPHKKNKSMGERLSRTVQKIKNFFQSKSKPTFSTM